MICHKNKILFYWNIVLLNKSLESHDIKVTTSSGTSDYLTRPTHQNEDHTCLHKTDTHQSLCPLQFLCPLILQRQCIRCLTRRVHIICSPNIYKMDTPWERKSIMDSVKQKIENPNKLTLKQFYRLHPWQHPSLYTPPSLKISINPKNPTTSKSQPHQGLVTTLRDLLTKTKTTPRPHHLTPNVIHEISCNDCTATYLQWTDP